MDDCVFCKIIEGTEPAEILADDGVCITIVPLNPVTEGHVLVIPKTHVRDFADDHIVSAYTMVTASLYAYRNPGEYNLITSRGKNATQSVFHLHIHLVPRRENDGLALPWYSGKKKR
jgi:histidine triad (HIT) family protein